MCQQHHRSLPSQDTKVTIATSTTLFIIAEPGTWREFGKDSLVQGQTDSIVLLDGSVEQALHHPVVSNALDDVSLQAVLGGDARGHEPLCFVVHRVTSIIG